MDLNQKARNYAFLLLKYRLRSEKELVGRLRKKNFSEEVIKNTLDFLREKLFIDDNVFAKAWIESRLKKPFGLRKIIQELNAKGVAKEIIDTQVQKIKSGYSEDKAVLKIVEDKLTKLKGLDADKAKRRLYALLLRRGFSPEVVVDLIDSLGGDC